MAIREFPAAVDAASTIPASRSRLSDLPARVAELEATVERLLTMQERVVEALCRLRPPQPFTAGELGQMLRVVQGGRR
jgi:hypothetical protein